MPDPSTPDISGMDRLFARRFLWLGGLPVRYLFRLRFEGLEKLRLEQPGMIVSNHNLGCWGGLEGFALGYVWYWRQREPPDLVHQGGTAFFKLPFGPTLARRAGVVPASLEGMGRPLREGRWVHIQPGGVADQYRPIWQRNRPRLKKVSWVGTRPVMTDQLGYVSVAAQGGYPIYPLAVSGSQEMAPVLYETSRLLRWTGLLWLRRDEHWPSFPITLNHFVNLGLLLLSPFASSLWAWVIFLLANIYADWVYQYPLLPIQLRMRIGEPIQVPRLADHASSAQERQEHYRRIHQHVVQELGSMLDELDSSRIWTRAARVTAGLIAKRRGARAPSVSSAAVNAPAPEDDA